MLPAMPSALPSALPGHAACLRGLAFICFALLLASPPVLSQTLSDAGQNDEPFSFVGLRLDDLIMRFGIPQTVYAARGGENWQDDVVFVYNEGDFFIYRDRVWQIGVKSAIGMRIGDAKAVAFLVLGEDLQDQGDYLLYSFSGRGWPLSLRINLSGDRISAIYVFRPDY